MLSGGMKIVKYLIFFFNLLIWLVGLALIVTGAVVQIKFNSYLMFFDTRFNAAAIFLIVVGVIIFTIAFFGCCGAVQENYCMLVTFVILLCVILILEIAAAIVAFVFRSKLTETVKMKMKETILQYSQANKGVKIAWDDVQHSFKCCGVESYMDWKNNSQLAVNNSVPDKCCRDFRDGCGYNKAVLQPNPNATIYTEGCFNTFNQWAHTNIGIVGGIAAGFTLVEIIGIIIAGCLASAIRRDYEVV